MTQDHFPQTQYTRIDGLLALGESGRGQLNSLLMSLYGEPLKVYFLGSSARALGEPDEIVHGFLADRLGRGEYIAQWRSSGLQLRRWLMNGLCLYLRELQKRERRRQGRELNDDALTFSGDPEREADRAYVVAVVQEAVRRAGEDCESRGLGRHWHAFRRRYYDGLSAREVGAEIGCTPEEADVMVRSAKRRFRAALTDLLAIDAQADGSSPGKGPGSTGGADLDGTIRELLEALGT